MIMKKIPLRNSDIKKVIGLPIEIYVRDDWKEIIVTEIKGKNIYDKISEDWYYFGRSGKQILDIRIFPIEGRYYFVKLLNDTTRWEIGKVKKKGMVDVELCFCLSNGGFVNCLHVSDWKIVPIKMPTI